MDELRRACAAVAERARSVQVRTEQIALYAATLPLESPGPVGETEVGASREERAAFWLALDAINFGSGWFPTLRKR